jgi:hypothetical protein
MQLLYKAYACEQIGGEKLLLPGYLCEPPAKPVPPGKKIRVELADGTCVEAIALNTKLVALDESILSRLNIRANPNAFYYDIQVPDDFSPVAVNLGVNVYLDE